MAKPFAFTLADIDVLVEALESQIEDLHADTMDADASDPDRNTTIQVLTKSIRILERLDPEHPLVVEKPLPGVEYDFESALGEDEDADEDNDDGGDEVVTSDGRVHVGEIVGRRSTETNSASRRTG